MGRERKKEEEKATEIKEIKDRRDTEEEEYCRSYVTESLQ